MCMKIGLNCHQASKELKERITSYLQDEGYEILDLVDDKNQEPQNSSKWVIEKEWTVIPNAKESMSGRPHAALTISRLPGVSFVGVKETSGSSVKMGADLAQLLLMVNEAWVKPALYKRINYKTVWKTIKKAKKWTNQVKKSRQERGLDSE